MVFDVIVVGGSLVGSSLALALAQSGLHVAVVEAHHPAPVAGGEDWDSRIYALSPGSVEFLDSCGAWQGVDATRVCRVEDMRIFGDDGRSTLDFSAYDAGLGELAMIVESGQLQTALWSALRAHGGVEIIAPAVCASMDLNAREARIGLADGRQLQARLVVGADGGDSWVRSEAGIGVAGRAYGQTAVVANFASEQHHFGIARQWFRRDGILALLPLPGDRLSMVWSTGEAQAAELMALAPHELAAQVAMAGTAAPDDLRVVTPAAAFPLRLQQVRHLVRPRLALVGDAAHSVHPLAGQGVNLGFRDARELAAVLAARGAQNDCGDYALLRRYERARREDIATMQMATDALQRLFNNDSPGLAQIRNLGLRLTNRQSKLKNLLIQHAVG